MSALPARMASVPKVPLWLFSSRSRIIPSTERIRRTGDSSGTPAEAGMPMSSTNTCPQCESAEYDAVAGFSAVKVQVASAVTQSSQ